MHASPQASRPQRPRRLLLRLALALAALSTLVGAGAAAAADPHGYPRTYHIWGGWYGSQALAKYDLLIGYESNWDVAALRAQNPEGIYLLSPGLNPGQIHSYDMVHLTYGAVDKWSGGTCPDPIGWVPRFDPATDYLRRPDGSLALVGGSWSHPGFNLARPQTAEKVAKIFACAALRDGLYTKGWDGVWSDNWIHTIGRSWFYGSQLDTDLNGVADDPVDLRRRWDNGLALAGAKLRELLPGKTVGGNGIWYGSSGHQGEPGSWLGEANITQMEYQNDYYRKSAEFVSIVNEWLSHSDPTGLTRYFVVEQAAMTESGAKYSATGDLNASHNVLNPGVMKGMRWGLTLALMTGAYFEVNPDQMHDARWWYDEYDGGVGIRERGYLGDAVTGPRQLAPSVWRRDFENGIALNNSTDAAAVVQLESPYRHLAGTQNPSLNDGSTVESVTIPAHDGVILLRTVPFDPPDGGTGEDPGFGEGPGAEPADETIAEIARVRVPRRGRLVVRVDGARRTLVKVAARSPQGWLLAKAERRIGPKGTVRYRLDLPPRWRKRVIKLQMAGLLDERRVEEHVRLRLSRSRNRIVWAAPHRVL
ncbi:MAG TPA: putative glycoside hydrolase [Gaiellaceae bacterium]|nr:putative glycoside hydrolase [Gaiellaceae bacterium]